MVTSIVNPTTPSIIYMTPIGLTLPGGCGMRTG
jgi:hypothetical protein